MGMLHCTVHSTAAHGTCATQGATGQSSDTPTPTCAGGTLAFACACCTPPKTPTPASMFVVRETEGILPSLTTCHNWRPTCLCKLQPQLQLTLGQHNHQTQHPQQQSPRLFARAPPPPSTAVGTLACAHRIHTQLLPARLCVHKLSGTLSCSPHACCFAQTPQHNS
jgi:hypothetical protein